MIPVDTKESINQYVAKHCPVGGFLKAVLSNDLFSAMGRADENNRANLFDIISYLWNEVPGNCWGSPEAVQSWLHPEEAQDDSTGS